MFSWQPLSSTSLRGFFHSNVCYAVAVGALCRLCIRRKFQHAIDIEYDHQLAVEPVDAAGELGHARVEIDGVLFAALVGQAQDLSDLVDQQTIGFTAQVDANR